MLGAHIKPKARSLSKAQPDSAEATIQVHLPKVGPHVAYHKIGAIAQGHVQGLIEPVDGETRVARGAAQVAHGAQSHITVLAVHGQVLYRANVHVGIVVAQVHSGAFVEAQAGVAGIDAGVASKGNGAVAVADAHEVARTFEAASAEGSVLHG